MNAGVKYDVPTSNHPLLSAAQSWHNRQLTGLFVLQADEVVNIAATAKQRYAG